jgi:hypothetical protein
MSKGIYKDDDRIPGKRRKFDQKLHDYYDPPAREKIKNMLGDFVEEHPDKYKQDFIIKSDKCKYKYLEVQVCSTWIHEKYPFEKLWVYARKSLYGEDTIFITLNRMLTRGYIFDAASLKDVKPRRLKKYSREFVYDVPWHRVMEIYVPYLDKETVESY